MRRKAVRISNNPKEQIDQGLNLISVIHPVAIVEAVYVADIARKHTPIQLIDRENFSRCSSNRDSMNPIAKAAVVAHKRAMMI